MARVLDWLSQFPGDSWQEHWLLGGSDTAGKQWGPPGLTQSQRCRLTAGLSTLIVRRAVRRSYAWLCGSRLLGGLRRLPAAQPG
ncbi:hypothetical protein [Streptomyces sp. Ncost-T10-10d]|uniref:hypothetical protein n=1 Tax=Streptomyces sp. Ncost-T10-10d TaxID=1839774 RepID=UPI00081F0690|nr:hypothetical protein [Streptomyces sp. Ncost-T10-10d]SCF65386.1 hypothetical protein GA0115254_10961 [Streptomyces sp. Ncost-T10-10d]